MWMAMGVPISLLPIFPMSQMLLSPYRTGVFAEASARMGLVGPSTLPLGFGTHFFDADSDGDLDLFVANGHIFPNVSDFSSAESYPQTDQFFRNTAGVFEDVSESVGFTSPAVSRGSALGDIDADGDLGSGCARRRCPSTSLSERYAVCLFMGHC